VKNTQRYFTYLVRNYNLRHASAYKMHFFAAFLFHFFGWFCFDGGGTPIFCTHSHTRTRTYYLYLSLFHPSINGCVMVCVGPSQLVFYVLAAICLAKKKEEK